MTKRVVSVGPLSPHRGGISHYHTLLCRALAKQSTTTAFGFSRLYPDRLFPGKTQLDESESAIDFPSTRAIDSIDPRTWITTGRAVRDARPDRLVFQWWHPFFFPSYAGVAKIARRHRPESDRPRVVFVCHNVRPHESNIANDVVLRAAFTLPDAFVVHAESERAALQKLAPGKPVVVHPHPPYDVFTSDTLPSREDAKRALGLHGRVLLFFGLVRAYKGLMTVVDALPILRDELKKRGNVSAEENITLVVAGEFYDDKAPYDARLKAHGVEGAVQIHDRYIENADVAQYFRAADVVVQPYLHATQSGISQIAFAMERAVIATHVGGLPEAIDDGRTGLLVPPNDPRALAAAILRFYDENLGPEMESAIKERAPPTWDGLADAVLRV